MNKYSDESELNHTHPVGGNDLVEILENIYGQFNRAPNAPVTRSVSRLAPGSSNGVSRDVGVRASRSVPQPSASNFADSTQALEG